MSWALFDRIRAFARQAGVYQQERLLQDQTSLERMIASGQFLNFSQQQSLLDQTNLQINRLERYKDYDQMSEVGEIALCLDLYADESSLVDPEYKHTIIIKAKSRIIKRELEDLFFGRLLIDNNIRAMVRYLCKYGDAPFEIVPNHKRTGVASLKFMNVYNFTRIETKFGDLVGFFFQDEVMTEPTFLHPWQTMHMRLLSYEDIFAPYGMSILEGGRKAFKQLRLMEDAALIYRITRAPQKRVFTIPIGLIPTKEVPEYLQTIARQFKNMRFYDQRTGTFNERFSPLIQEDDYFLPQRPDGSGPKIDTLPGAENLDQIADIEYFKKKMIAPMKIPFNRVGIGEGGDDSKSVASQNSEFAKAVQWVQREVAMGLTKVAICHLAMAGFTAEQLKEFSVFMTATNAIDELYRMETWNGRTRVMADLKDLGWFPPEWIVSRFTDLSPDEIQELELETKEGEGEEGEEMGKGMPGLPPISGLLEPDKMDKVEGDKEGGDNMDNEDGKGGEGGGGDKNAPKLEIADSVIPGYDHNLEKRVIVESKGLNKSGKLNRTRDEISDNIPYKYFSVNNELAGLPIGEGKERPSLIDEKVEQEVKEEYKRLMINDGNEVVDDTITSSDTPS